MEISLTIQYILVGAIVLAACYALFRTIRRNFIKKKGKKHAEFGCNTNCGSSRNRMKANPTAVKNDM